MLAEGVNLQQAGRIINYDLPWNPMRIVQRHGRIDRIGSQYREVHLGVFFPAERLDEMLRLEETLGRKLAQAAAAVGTGEVLPGRKPTKDVILADPDEAIEQLEDILRKSGTSAALSGEEYRRRLFSATTSDPALASKYQALPYGSGSGFESTVVDGNGYVFCIRIGQGSELHKSGDGKSAVPRKPWFRYVRCDEDWHVAHDENGIPLVSDDTLTSLVTADPTGSEVPRWVTDEVYNGAFDAWQIARKSVWEAWTRLTDPANLEPEIPKSFRDAAELVRRSGSFLGIRGQDELCRRLGSVPITKIGRAVRAALNEGNTDEQRIDLVRQVLDKFGIQVPPPPEPLPYVNLEEVHLVAWMAVKGATPDKQGTVT